MPSDNKPLPGPILTQIYAAIWRHLDTVGWNIRNKHTTAPRNRLNVQKRLHRGLHTLSCWLGACFNETCLFSIHIYVFYHMIYISCHIILHYRVYYISIFTQMNGQFWIITVQNADLIFRTLVYILTFTGVFFIVYQSLSMLCNYEYIYIYQLRILLFYFVIGMYSGMPDRTRWERIVHVFLYKIFEINEKYKYMCTSKSIALLASNIGTFEFGVLVSNTFNVIFWHWTPLNVVCWHLTPLNAACWHWTPLNVLHWHWTPEQCGVLVLDIFKCGVLTLNTFECSVLTLNTFECSV